MKIEELIVTLGVGTGATAPLIGNTGGQVIVGVDAGRAVVDAGPGDAPALPGPPARSPTRARTAPPNATPSRFGIRTSRDDARYQNSGRAGVGRAARHT